MTTTTSTQYTIDSTPGRPHVLKRIELLGASCTHAVVLMSSASLALLRKAARQDADKRGLLLREPHGTLTFYTEPKDEE